MTRRATFRQADLLRAIKAAEAAVIGGTKRERAL